MSSYIKSTDLVDKLATAAMSLGQFEEVQGHEPRNAPGVGTTCCIWVTRREPIQSSGLASTSVRVETMHRLYRNALADTNLDIIETEMQDAADALVEYYTGHFQLGDVTGAVRMVDLLGAYGAPLGYVSGYLNVSGTQYRVIDVTVPLILNDQFDQEA